MDTTAGVALSLPPIFGGSIASDGEPDSKRPRVDNNPTALPSLPFAPSLLSDHAGDKTASDDEADEILAKHFPRFFYGKVLKFSEVLDGNSGTAAKKPIIRHRTIQSARRPRSRRIVDCTEDESLRFETTKVPTVVLPSRSERLTEHRSDVQQNESEPQSVGASGSAEKRASGDTQNERTTTAEAEPQADANGSLTSGSSADPSEKGALNMGDSDLMLLDQLNWEDDVVWEEKPSETQRNMVLSQSIVNNDFGNTPRRRRSALGDRAGKPSKSSTHLPSSTSVSNASPGSTIEKKSAEVRTTSSTSASSQSVATSAVAPIKKPSFDVSSFVKEAPVVKAGTTKEREDEEEAKRTEAAVVIPKEIAKSMFAPKTDMLGSGQWLEDIVWDGGDKAVEPADSEPGAAPAGKEIPVLFDLNDPHLLPDVTIEKPVFMRPRHRIKQFSGRNRIPTWKLREFERDFELKRQARLKGDLPPPNSRDDPFIEVANDKVYRTKEGKTATDFALKKCLGRKVPGLDHSTLARKLDLRCFAADWDERSLRNFHRPKLHKECAPAGASKRMSDVLSTVEQRELKRPKLGKWKAHDLTTIDATGQNDIVLAEYCEQHPLLIHNSGMCMLIRNYYKQKDASDAIPKAKFLHGANALIGPRDASPFLGNLAAETSLQSMENNLYRAPMYCHRMSITDFVVTRMFDEHEKRDKYFVRRLPHVYTIGQVLPKLEIPAPNSKEAKMFAIKRLSVYIQRLFLCDADAVVRVEEIRHVFPTYSETNIRKRLRDVATFTRGIDMETSSRNAFDNGAWERDRSKELPTDAALQAELTPEQVCTYEAMLAAVQRIRDMGYDRDTFDVKELEDGDADDANDAGEEGTKRRRKKFTVEDELRLAPWHLSTDFLNYVRDKCLLYITGKGEPTGCGEGFSYLRQPHRVDGAETQYSAAGAAVTKKQTPLAGSAADLRTLYLKPAKELLITKYGVDPEFLKTKDRWQIIDIVRQKSTEEALATECGNQFARGQRSTAAERKFEFTQECQRIFDQQNRSLASNEPLSSSDEDSDDSDGDGDTAADTQALQEALGDRRLVAAQRNKKYVPHSVRISRTGLQGIPCTWVWLLVSRTDPTGGTRAHHWIRWRLLDERETWGSLTACVTIIAVVQGKGGAGEIAVDDGSGCTVRRGCQQRRRWAGHGGQRLDRGERSDGRKWAHTQARHYASRAQPQRAADAYARDGPQPRRHRCLPPRASRAWRWRCRHPATAQTQRASCWKASGWRPRATERGGGGCHVRGQRAQRRRPCFANLVGGVFGHGGECGRERGPAVLAMWWHRAQPHQQPLSDVP
eukprot:m.898334 g.898334  ORF g.898334 m.898334 type:complete len:1321 (-) comp23673_c0_seq2:1169-5131(-)